ncbi:MAG: replicative DNA helicase [Alphaproteobacteria bacterium]|nr:replicative DNA helicase [Alphaproteobacteria bacterium]
MEKLDVTKLPKNIEAEQALLGALLANNKAYEKISELLKPAFFADATHQKIFAVISKLITKGHVADIVTLKSYFEQEGSLNEVGGFPYLVQLAESASPLTNVEYYAQFIYDKYLRRELINTGYEIVNNALIENIDLSAIDQINQAEKSLYNLADSGDAKGGFIDFSTALTSSLSAIEKAYQKEGRISGVPTSLAKLDYKIGGLNNSDLIIIAGRPAMGKTALATNIAYNVAEFFSHDKETAPEDRGVAFFSLEMSADELAARILSTVTQTPSHKMRTGELDASEFTRIAAAVRELENIPLYIDDTPGVSINAIRNRARRLKRSKGLGLIVIDYIQLISGTGDRRSEGNRVQELSEISRGLKILAKELNVPVIALSQLNRGVESRDDKRPLMSDLRESGSIEQDADIVMFVFRENYYIHNAEPKQQEGEDAIKFQKKHDDWVSRDRQTANLAEVIIGKQRHGPTGTVKLYWNGEYTQFGNLAEEDKLPEQRG